jgi:hypothetical protein
MAIEIRSEVPLEGVVNFYQATERFQKYCLMCKKNAKDRIICSSYARENLDLAYFEYLVNYHFILPARGGVKPISIPLSRDISTEELKKMFESQIGALDREEIKKYLGYFNRIKEECLKDPCEWEKIESYAGAIHALAKDVKKCMEKFYTEDFLSALKNQLEDAARDPEAFKSFFPFPPKPLKEEYRL